MPYPRFLRYLLLTNIVLGVVFLFLWTLPALAVFFYAVHLFPVMLAMYPLFWLLVRAPPYGVGGAAD